MPARQGTDAAVAMAMGHVILTEYHKNGESEYFNNYVRQYNDMPHLVMLEQKDNDLVQWRNLRSSDLAGNLGQTENSEWKTVLIDKNSSVMGVPNGTTGSRWDKSAKWNLEEKNVAEGSDFEPILSLVDQHDEVVAVGYPYFANQQHDQEIFSHTDHDSVLLRNVPARRITLADGSSCLVATVFDLQMANYGVDQGLG